MSAEADKLSAILAVADAVRDGEPIEGLLARIVDAAARHAGGRTQAVLLWDEPSNAFRIQAQRGIDDAEFVRTYRNRVGTRIVGEIVWSGRSAIYEELPLESPEYEDLRLQRDYASAAVAAIVVEHRTVGYIHCDADSKGAYGDDALQFLRLLADLAVFALERHHLLPDQPVAREGLQRVWASERFDPAFDVLTYPAFAGAARREIAASRDASRDVGVILLDLDNYAAYRDMHGREESTALMRDVVRIAKERVRAVDLLAKHGPDELIALLPGADLDHAARAAEAIRGQIEACRFRKSTPWITASVGVVASKGAAASLADLMTAVGGALIEAQRQGRNRVVSRLVG